MLLQERLDAQLTASEATAQGLKAAYDAAFATMETQLLEAEQSKWTAVKHAKKVCTQSHEASWNEYLEKRTEADDCCEKELQTAKAAYNGTVLAEQNKLEQARQALEAGQLDVCQRRTERKLEYRSQQKVVCQLTRLLNSADQVSIQSICCRHCLTTSSLANFGEQLSAMLHCQPWSMYHT